MRFVVRTERKREREREKEEEKEKMNDKEPYFSARSAIRHD